MIIQVTFNVSDNIDGSATSYTIQFSDSTSSTDCKDSVTIPASSCSGRVCNYEFEIANSSCSLSADITVTAFATNVFGDGRHSTTSKKVDMCYYKFSLILFYY